MIEKLIQIQKVRDEREQNAQLDFKSLSNARDAAAYASVQLDEFFQKQQREQKMRQGTLQQQSIQTTLSVKDLHSMMHTIAVQKSDLKDVANRCDKVREMAKEAAAVAEVGRIRYARILRSKKKWDRVIEVYSEQADIEELQREELTQEDTALLRR